MVEGGREAGQVRRSEEHIMGAPARPLPTIIQGGMGVGISGWRLANAVARTGELGVVSGTALEIVCARRLQDGDPGGHVRRALAHLPIPGVAERITSRYYLHGGKPRERAYRPVPMFGLEPSRELQELTLAANFVEVFLAKEGHDGVVGVNYLRKIELPIPAACLGAMLAGVDYVLVGAGNPADLPRLLDDLADRRDTGIAVKVQGSASSAADAEARVRPNELLGGSPAVLRRPTFLAIVASVDLAAGLAADPRTRPDGFVVEGPSAGGHNAPPRGPRRTDDRGQPVYDQRDDVDLVALTALGLPFWLAGSFGTPEGLQRARDLGAAGVQVGTAFAACRESGMALAVKRRLLQKVAAGTVDVRTDWRASPTGFPFKVVQVEGTLSDPEVYRARPRVCDLGVLRVPYTRADGSLGYRCPAEPVGTYTEHKGGRVENTHDRQCLCNGLLAAAGHPQRRADGYTEPALATGGTDYATVAHLMGGLQDGQSLYGATDVIAHLRGEGHLAGSAPR
jgi:NAD(P)H-dependent flavin oxidoreductase YrpB (nitropropane dioxygenase family)